jgi:hypothetical protein
LTTVTAGSCSNSVYTFTITGTTSETIAANAVTSVTLTAPTGVTPTCTPTAVTVAQAGGSRRLAEAATLTCTISSALNSATITVSAATIGSTTATIANPISMTGTATCTASSNDGGDYGADDNSGLFTYVNPYIMFMFAFLF